MSANIFVDINSTIIGENLSVSKTKEVIDSINAGLYDLNQVKKDPNTQSNYLTPLIYAIYRRQEKIALALIATGKSRPANYANKYGFTALILACETKQIKVALALIATGQSKPEHVSSSSQTTALYWATYRNCTDIILALIATGKSRPEQISGGTSLDGRRGPIASMHRTALINMAQFFEKDRNVDKQLQAVRAIIATGKSLPNHKDGDGYTALDYAIKLNAPDLIDLLISASLNDVTSTNSVELININAIGFDQITQESHKISDFLKESNDNICIKSNKTYFLTSKEIIKKNLKFPVNIKYGCKSTGNDSRFILDSNIIYKHKYISMSSIIGLQILVNYNEIEKIVTNKTSANLFSVSPTNTKFPAIISEAFINGGNGVSADHCQPGKETIIYNINAAQPFCGESEELETINVSKKRRRAEGEGNDDEDTNMEVDEVPNLIKVQYKGQIFSFSITETNNLEDIKRMLLEKLMTENLITSINQNVKFIYKGKIYKENLNNTVLTSLENPPFGITLQTMVSPTNGGRKTKKLYGMKTKQSNKNKRKRNKYTRNKKRHNCKK